MADMLSTAVSALQAYRRGLDTTSHNVANVGTEGYSRQRMETATREAQPYGNGWIGSGVDVTTVRRAYDEFMSLQYRSTTSGHAQQEAMALLAERVNSLYSDSSTGLAASLQKFANALQSVANAPSSMPARQVLLSEANALAAQLASYDARLEALGTEVNQRLASGVADVNSLAQGIARLNGEIVVALGRGGGQPPNDLLDQRDLLLDQLAQQVTVNTVAQEDGSLNVFVGTGQPLVLATQAARLATAPDAFDASRLQVMLETPSGRVDISRNLTGGELGGLVAFRDGMLDDARNRLGQVAVGVTQLVNDFQASGMGLDGQAGPALFGVGGVDVLRASTNAPGATVTVARADATAITTANYVIAYDGSAWNLRRADTGAAVPMTGTGTAADPFVAAGLEFTVGGAPTAGDQFLVRPTAIAARGMNVLFTDPARLAAASPVIASSGSTNTGAATPGALSVVDAANPALRTTANVQFLTATTYSIDGGPAQAWVPGQAITANGWSLQLEGAPAAGDTFSVRSNATGVGDNRNFLALGQALSKPYLDGGTTSIDGAISRTVADVGVRTREAQVARDALQAVQQDAVAARDSVSGVNLDEEAANMIRYQQAYQAAAQIVQVANATFDTLIGAIRR